MESDRPTLRARRGKGNGARAVPLHPKLRTALIAATSYGAMGPGRLIESYRTTAWGRVQSAVELAEERAQLATGRHVGTHTLRHSYTRNLMKNVTPLNPQSQGPGHSDIKTTPIYLELAPDPTGNLLMVA